MTENDATENDHTETSRRPRIAITQGDPDGIGPEVLVAALSARAVSAGAAAAADIVVLGDAAVLEAAVLEAAAAEIAPTPLNWSIRAAPVGGCEAALWALEEACRLAVDGEIDAIVTAPIHKADLTEVGFTFPGQTEFLGARLGGVDTTMMLAGPSLRVGLVTTHLPLRDVPDRIDTASVLATIERTHEVLIRGYGITEPRIAVLGLNPHAGERGLFGDEDANLIAPAVSAASAAGIDCTGPLPGDGTFAPHSRERFDAFVAMYHDQGLAPLKALDGGRAVNVTLGLPVPRTSPDHGTARDIAGRGVADPTSMIAALDLAVTLARGESCAVRPGHAD